MIKLRFLQITGLLFVVSTLLTAQQSATKFSHTFGAVSFYELNLKNYEPDKDAEALVIYDIAKSKFISNGFKILFERKTKIKIFKTAGIKYANIEIPYYGEENNYETIDSIIGFTYCIENGGIHKIPLDLKTIYEEKIDDKRKLKKFALPDVKEGSIIEISYQIVTPYLFNLHDWEFQSTIPTLYSEYEVRLTPFYSYVSLLQGDSKTIQHNSYEDKSDDKVFRGFRFNEIVHSFIATDVQAFKDEGYITSIDDYIIKVDFQMTDYLDSYGSKKDVISTWQNLCRDLMDRENFGSYIKNSSSKSESIFNYNSIISVKPKEKLKIIQTFVKSNFSWDGRDTPESTKSVKEFIKEKTGSSGDINLFLCGMLRNAGIKAIPVILSTRDHGKIKYDYPFLHFFNYTVVLVQIDSTNMLADATDPFCPYNLLPEKCINDRGMIVDKKYFNWISLTQSAFSNVRDFFNIKFSENCDSVNFFYKEMNFNYYGLELRKRYNSKYENIEKYITDKGFVVIDSVKVENFLNLDEPMTLSCYVNRETERINDKIYISPFMNEPVSENPFRQNSRTYNIDLKYKIKRQFNSEIEIPEGYKLFFLPTNQQTLNNLVQFEYKITQIGSNKILITGYYSFSQSIYDANDYYKLKSYYNDIIKKFNEKIVLVKKEIAD
jgi:hypothetical protein